MYFPFTLLFYLSILARSRGQSSVCKSPLVSPAEFLAEQYDYIIIGGGTAGLTVAARLSEVVNLSIGVLEAGYLHIPDANVSTPVCDHRNSTQVKGTDTQRPADYNTNLTGNPEYDWMMSTDPQVSTANRSIPQLRGKLMGGSSAINSMAWTRASIPEYAGWDALNNYSGEWSWDGLLPYFLKSERRKPNPVPRLPGFMPSYYEDGFLGPVEVGPNALYSDIVPPYIDTMNQLDIPTIYDAMSGNISGLTNVLVAIDRETGTRVDSSTAHYCPNAGRPNLRILSGATATRILFQDGIGEGGLRATDVSFMSNNSYYTVNATQEVILSTGVFKTPQLLELSGIGNATLLKEFGIDPLLDLPGVGENLQEHIFITTDFELNGGYTTFDNFSNPAFAAEQMEIYNNTGGGWLAATSPAVTFLPHAALLVSPSSASLLDSFDASLAQLSNVTPLAQAQYELQRSWISGGQIPEVETIQLPEGVVDVVAGQNYMTVLSGLMHPVSRGSVHINSTNPLVAPRIIGNYLTADYDAQVLLELLRFNPKIALSPPLSASIASQVSPPADLQSDDDLISFIREAFAVGDHVLGTAAMVSKELGGVVDEKLVVYGTENLRVIDVSVFPTELAAHLQATVYAIAEKASDMIKLAYQSQ
ncbi:alcohol oxidase [Rhizopogon vinicolor AM-OR11-026]|uniref:Alcohol oxidase n=1 Tax=Rhizopogon vinicolor AM-OR11-026 TaxID=1314800 RepID=A0A1B7N7U7_9AGAM|nr:alcohol oxidase [Rhizopogon vinicolor AM-OR11-026]